MKKYLIDVNLPCNFALWNNEDFVHQKDINDEWTDEQIWYYAKENNLTIVSKDSDFSNRIILSSPPPKVIHIKFGNLKFKEFYLVITKMWNTIVELSDKYKLVNVFTDRIEGIN
jgi:predicted nuclease of predicted toxin-antitoxin system